VLSVPARVVKKRYALTAKPLFSGDMALRSIVMAGELQHSANRYSKKSPVIEIQKLVWINVQTAIVGHPKTEPILEVKNLGIAKYLHANPGLDSWIFFLKLIRQDSSSHSRDEAANTDDESIKSEVEVLLVIVNGREKGRHVVSDCIASPKSKRPGNADPSAGRIDENLLCCPSEKDKRWRPNHFWFVFDRLLCVKKVPRRFSDKNKAQDTSDTSDNSKYGK